MKKHDLIVIGAGPGGYVAAIRAAQLGLDVACVDNNPKLGGTCLRVGCIPSKAMLEMSERYYEARYEMKKYGIIADKVRLDLEAMHKHKTDTIDTLAKGIEGLFKKNKITRVEGLASFVSSSRIEVLDKKGKKTEMAASHFIIATGSVPVSLPGIEVDGKDIGFSSEALNYEQPPEHLVVIGGGYIGLEMGSVWNRLGSKVTVVEYFDRILPNMDHDLSTAAKKQFEKQGIEFLLSSKVAGAKAQESGVVVEIEDGEPIKCDKVLMAVGRKANTDKLNLDKIGVKVDDRGRVLVDEHWQTNVEGVFAIGDVIPGLMLAHKAEEEGLACADYLVTGHGEVNYDAIPGVVYTHPEIASVGKTEQELKADGIAFKTGKFSFAASGRARAMGQTDGMVKMLAHAHSDRILGAHIIGPRAGDLIAEVAVAISFGASSEDLAHVSHAHPTLAEAIKEAAIAASGGQAIHM